MRFFKKVKNTVIYAGAFCGYKITQFVPRRIGITLFGAIGAFAYIFPNEEKRRTLRHLKLIYGNEWSDSQISRCARDVYVNLGKNLFDGLHFSNLSKDQLDKIVTTDSFDEFSSAYNEGRGVVAITAHTGCFEMLLHYFALKGFKCFAIGRKLYDERLEKLIRKNRSGENILYMNRTENPRKLIRELQSGKVFGVLVDQDTKVEGVFAKFLGKTAFTPSGPVKMAMKMRLPVFVSTTARMPDNTHHIFISKRLQLEDSGNFEKDLVANVEMVNDFISDSIRRYPSQWVWMHRRWKQQPQGAGQEN